MDTARNISSRATVPQWDTRIAMLLRPDGRLQLGWNPERAMTLTPPPGIDSRGLQSLLRSMDGRTTLPSLLWKAAQLGVAPATMEALVDELTRSGYLRHADTATGPVRIHGRGPLSDAIAGALRSGGVSARRSHGYTNSDVVGEWNESLVVLTDDVVTDPRLVADLVRGGLPHLSVRLRDGTAVVGPLVLPGRSSCLRCADIVRSAADPDWLHLSAQLLGSAGHAEASIVHAAVSFALSEIDAVLNPRTHAAPSGLSATVEIELNPYRVTTRRWPRQSSCSCQYLAPDTGEERVGQP
ncbi:bacteriocin biosynthesis cyclodehydratase domain-containing protein [Rhodococcus sp. 27YEA15]|uniref:hypothetical protein n=1 Tax=Rhodococcus sp. 27YEA15 TaxID=3156259 RepID=UPI003C7D5DEF